MHLSTNGHCEWCEIKSIKCDEERGARAWLDCADATKVSVHCWRSIVKFSTSDDKHRLVGCDANMQSPRNNVRVLVTAKWRSLQKYGGQNKEHVCKGPGRAQKCQEQVVVCCSPQKGAPTLQKVSKRRPRTRTATACWNFLGTYRSKPQPQCE